MLYQLSYRELFYSYFLSTGKAGLEPTTLDFEDQYSTIKLFTPLSFNYTNIHTPDQNGTWTRINGFAIHCTSQLYYLVNFWLTICLLILCQVVHLCSNTRLVMKVRHESTRKTIQEQEGFQIQKRSKIQRNHHRLLM